MPAHYPHDVAVRAPSTAIELFAHSDSAPRRALYGAEVLIVGGGPVGALAIDLAQRGIEVAVAETRASVTTTVCGCARALLIFFLHE